MCLIENAFVHHRTTRSHMRGWFVLSPNVDRLLQDAFGLPKSHTQRKVICKTAARHWRYGLYIFPVWEIYDLLWKYLHLYRHLYIHNNTTFEYVFTIVIIFQNIQNAFQKFYIFWTESTKFNLFSLLVSSFFLSLGFFSLILIFKYPVLFEA